MEKFLCVIKPHSDESIYSYISRLTIENNYESNAWVLNNVKINTNHGPRNILPINFDFNNLLNLTNLGKDEIIKLTLYNELATNQNKFQHLNELLLKGSLMGKEAKICPKCLLNFDRLNKLWDIRILLVCPIHNCLLLTKCCKCGKGIRQYRKNLYYCKCGADLRDFLTKKVKKSDALTFPKLVYKAYYNDDKISIENNRLDGFKLSHLLLIYIFFVKLYFRDKTRTGSTAIPFNPDNNELFDLIINTSKIFDNWPKNFYSFLKNYEKTEKSKPKYDRGSIVNTFGYFYIDLYDRFSHQCFNFLRDEFENYLHLTWDKSLFSNSKYVIKNKESAKFLSVTDVSKILHTEHKQVRKLIKNGLLEAKNTTEGNPYIMVSRESVEIFQRNQIMYMTRREVREKLDISYSSVIDFEKKKLLKLNRGPNMDGCMEYFYDRAKVNQLLRILDKRYERNKNKLDVLEGGNLSLIDITSCPRIVIGISIVDVVLLILNNKLTPIYKDDNNKGLKQYLLLEEEVIEELFKYKIEKPNSVFSSNEVMRYLGITRSLLRRIINNDLIRYSKDMKKPFFLVEDVVKFSSKYISLSKISEILGENYESTLTRLNGMNINPLIDSNYKRYKIYSKIVLLKNNILNK